MYPVAWDPETGGILLSDHAGPETFEGEIRPVFYEELDLLGLNERWTYPPCPEPLLWALGRRYYHRGELVAEAKGGGFFEAPQVIVHREGLQLTPVDVPAMLARNAALLEGLAYRSVEFIHDQYHRCRRRTDIFAVAFSGGKDSLVVLDLVQRALAPDDFVVVFADTTMELPVTYEAVERARKYYSNLHFHVARSHLTAQESWRLFGPPSRMHRWCCSVHKTVPTMLKFREIMDSPALDAAVFDGCRREESQRRFGYTPVSAGCKHPTQVNISPILEWNSAETWLYLLSRKLDVNTGYRAGLARIGCVACPFNSEWGEFVAWRRFPASLEPLMANLMDYAERELGSRDGINEYVRQGSWKVRSGGRSLSGGGNRVIEADRGNTVSFRIRRRSEDLLEWLNVLGTVRQRGSGRGLIESDTEAGGASYPFEVVTHEDALEVTVSGVQSADRFFRRDLRAIANKAAYCVRCRSCEVECPSGALSVNGGVRIISRRCIRCSNCLAFVEKGCWAAKCLSVSAQGAGMKGVNAYQTFGMSREWLAEFFQNPDTWWRCNSRGPRQFEAMRVWLRHAEIVDRKQNAITNVGRSLQLLGPDSRLAWAAMWTNLARNSALVRWYVHAVPFGREWSKADLVETMDNSLSLRTRQNAITSLVRLLVESPLGDELGLGRLQPAAATSRQYAKSGASDVPPLALLYCVYRYAERVNRYDLSVAELLADAQEGPSALFGVGEQALVRALRGLSSVHSTWIRAELVRDLDNIYLERTRGSAEVLALA